MFQELAEDISELKSKIINKEEFISSARKIESKIQDGINNIKQRYVEATHLTKACSKVSLTTGKHVVI